jgi:hypothetical protein
MALAANAENPFMDLKMRPLMAAVSVQAWIRSPEISSMRQPNPGLLR